MQTKLGIQTEGPVTSVTVAMVQECVTERTMLITVQCSIHSTTQVSIMSAPHNGSASAQHKTGAVGTKWHSGGTVVAQWWHSGGTVVAQWWHSGGTVVAQWLT